MDDTLDENNSIKKKNAANIKDLTRQLQQMQKKLDQTQTLTPVAPPTNSSKLGLPAPLIPIPASTSSNSISQQTPLSNHQTMTTHGGKSSRTSSISSLNDKDHFFSNSIDDSDNRSLTAESINSSTRFNANQMLSGSNEEDVYVVDVDKQKIIEKICKLQKTLAKRNEKIEFLQEHVNQLTLDLKRKTRYTNVDIFDKIIEKDYPKPSVFKNMVSNDLLCLSSIMSNTVIPCQ